MEYYYEATVDGEGVSLYTTKRNEIMVAASYYDCSISEGAILEAVGANGFNTCFQTSDKREFAKGCNFENILISKREINDDTNNEVVCEYYLSELREDEEKLEELLADAPNLEHHSTKREFESLEME